MIIGYEAKRIYHNTSGLGNYGRQLISSLAEAAPENIYHLYNYRKGEIKFNPAKNVIERRPASRSKLMANLWRQRLVSSQARKEGVQIFHGLGQELPYGLKKRGIKSVVTVHDLIFLRYPNLYKFIDRSIYLKKVKHACKVADLVVAVSSQTRQDLMDYLNIPAEKIMVIHQGCHPFFWQQHQNNVIPLLEKYELPERFALFVGTLEPRKNPARLAKVCAELKIPLVLVGKPTPYWHKFIKESSVQQKSYWQHITVKSTRDLATLYSMADVFVYPSIFEGFGIPVLEALASQTPVITGKTSALPEVAGPGARLINVEAETELKEALQFFWFNEQERKKAVQLSSAYAEQFKDVVLAKNWLMLYEKLKSQ
jgi:glycosyltransferase involved in cell wall biosynthesis